MIMCNFEIEFMNKSDPSDTLTFSGYMETFRLAQTFHNVLSKVHEENCDGFEFHSAKLSIERTKYKSSRRKDFIEDRTFYNCG